MLNIKTAAENDIFFSRFFIKTESLLQMKIPPQSNFDATKGIISFLFKYEDFYDAKK